jgi:hypothetical protein
MRKILVWLLLALPFVQVKVSADIVLVDRGKAEATIVINRNAVDAVVDAAMELRQYVKKMSGAELPVAHDEMDIKGTKVLVGESRYTRELGLRNDDFADQEYLIRTVGGNLVLMGRDEPSSEVEKTAGKPGSMAKRYFQRTGTIYAVNTFLEKYCGVRWYLPDEIGEVVPERKTIEVGNVNLRRQPSVRVRTFSGWDKIPSTMWTWKDMDYPGELAPSKRLWWARRLKIGGEPFQCNHSFYGYYKRFGDKHPEWFRDSSLKTGNQLCLSNPEVFRQVVQDARDYFDGKLDDPLASASGDVFSVMPMDSRLWCRCDTCRDRFNPSRKKGSMFNNGYASDYVWDFVARVAREVAVTHPGKYISCCAYADYAEPPENVDIPSNVKVMICKFHWKHWDPRILRADRDIMEDWRKKLGSGENIYFWDYYIFPQYTSYEAFPSISPHFIADDIKAMKKGGMHGGQMAEQSGPPPKYALNLGIEHLRIYVTAKLLDDWDDNVDRILNEYYRLFYGPAEKPMKEFFTRIEEVYSADNPRLKTLVEIDTEPMIAVTIDLGSVQSISGISFSTAAMESSGVYWPASIRILVSEGGKNFSDVGELVSLSAVKGTPPDSAQGYGKHRFTADGLNVRGRYVRIDAKASGEYLFTDEIEVFGKQGDGNIAMGKSYTMSKQPNYQLTVDTADVVQLTDGKYTKDHFWSSKTTVGWQGGARLNNEFVWNILCPPEEIADYGRLLKKAKDSVPVDSVYSKRIDFIEKSLYNAVMAGSARKYQ